MRKHVPLTADILDKQRCETPNCTHDHSVIYLESACHPGGGQDVRYEKETHTMIFSCHVCDRESGRVLIAVRRLQ